MGPPSLHQELDGRRVEAIDGGKDAQHGRHMTPESFVRVIYFCQNFTLLLATVCAFFSCYYFVCARLFPSFVTTHVARTNSQDGSTRHCNNNATVETEENKETIKQTDRQTADCPFSASSTQSSDQKLGLFLPDGIADCTLTPVQSSLLMSDETDGSVTPHPC
eukprot:4763621-Amphidinium_carterae.2